MRPRGSPTICLQQTRHLVSTTRSRLSLRICVSPKEETSAGSVCIAVCPSETVASPFCEMTQSTLRFRTRGVGAGRPTCEVVRDKGCASADDVDHVCPDQVDYFWLLLVCFYCCYLYEQEDRDNQKGFHSDTESPPHESTDRRALGACTHCHHSRMHALLNS